MRSRMTQALVLAAVVAVSDQHARGECAGDCDRSDTVAVNELVTVVNVGLDRLPAIACDLADSNEDGRVSVDEIVTAVKNSIQGCAPMQSPTGSSTPTSTPVGNGTVTPTASSTMVPVGDCATIGGTFNGIQQNIFERYGCTAVACHASTLPQAGLDLSRGVAYDNVIEVTSTQVNLTLVATGEPNRSYLFMKLAAATDPALGFEIVGATMPVDPPFLSVDELEAFRLWILSGASETGSVSGTEILCKPPTELRSPVERGRRSAN